MKAQIRDIDSEFQKSNSASKVNKAGQAIEQRAKLPGAKAQVPVLRDLSIGDLHASPVAADAAAGDADVAKAHQGAEKLPATAAGRKATSSRIVR